MRREKGLLKQWKADLQAVQEEKRLKKKAKKKNKRYSIPGNTADLESYKLLYIHLILFVFSVVTAAVF
ncbi:hypothetical protein [Bacillus toyonensis]|uniref:hypothetical protein n=1 Tax=Bacillus toyonensis TaxID=155322 RepID=UPI00301B3CA1